MVFLYMKGKAVSDMKVKELVELIGVYEVVRIMDEDMNELWYCAAVDVPEEFSGKFIKAVYSSNDIIHIITTLDKCKRKCYNVKGIDAE